jgi:hypothetical protein
MVKNSYLVLLLIGIIFSMTFLSSINSNSNHQKVSAHIFTTDETASFVALADQLQVESELVQTNLVNNNLSFAQQHANMAASLLTPTVLIEIAEENQRTSDDLKTAINNLQMITSSSENQRQLANQLVNDINATLSEAVTMRIEQGQGRTSSNFLEQGIEFLRGIFEGGSNGEEVDDKVDIDSRIKPLAFADLVDSILINYGNAYAVDFDMTDMSNMVMMGGNSSMPMSGMATNGDNNNTSTNMSSMNMSSTMMMSTDSKTDKNYSLVNMTDFQSAQALTARALENFNTELRPIVPKNETGFVGNLEEGLTQLNDLIRNKASPMDIMMIVHTQIHPNLLEAFNLQLR